MLWDIVILILLIIGIVNPFLLVNITFLLGLPISWSHAKCTKSGFAPRQNFIIINNRSHRHTSLNDTRLSRQDKKRSLHLHMLCPLQRGQLIACWVRENRAWTTNAQKALQEPPRSNYWMLHSFIWASGQVREASERPQKCSKIDMAQHLLEMHWDMTTANVLL